MNKIKVRVIIYFFQTPDNDSVITKLKNLKINLICHNILLPGYLNAYSDF